MYHRCSCVCALLSSGMYAYQEEHERHNKMVLHMNGGSLNHSYVHIRGYIYFYFPGMFQNPSILHEFFPLHLKKNSEHANFSANKIHVTSILRQVKIC